MKAKDEDRATYNVNTQNDDDTICNALDILDSRLRTPGQSFTAPQAAKDFLRLKLALLEREVFAVIWLDSQNRMLAYEELFLGTLTQTSVYPREVVKACVKYNGASCILSHNHPSGVLEPSRADITMTNALKDALALVDCKVLDHIIVAGSGTCSLAERGEI